MSSNYARKSMLMWVLAILLTILSSALLATDKDNFKVISNSKTQIDLKFNLGAWNLETKTENGIENKSVKSSAKNMLFIDETETLPIYSAMLAIPDGMDVELVTNNTNVETVRSVNLQNRDMINSSKGSDDSYPSRQIVISEPGQLRDFRVVNVNVYPFQYDTKSNDLNVVQSADISLRLVPSRDAYRNTTPGYYSAGFENMYSGLILNYDSYRDEAVAVTQPRLLIIYPNVIDANFTSKLTEFVTWKKQKGYIVDIASTATGEAGSTTATIKTYIQNRYNNLSTRPDVILLIGDGDGSFIIPYYPSDFGDFPYTLLAGSDNYQDVQLGRITISSTSDFNMYVQRVFHYERDINPATASWLDRMLLVGDSSQSGVSTYYCNYYIEGVASAVNPNYTYTRLYSSGVSTSTMNTAINNGVGFYNYRGYMGMSGWPSTMGNINNPYKLNHGVFITCATSTFYSGTNTTESYLRLGTESLPLGGITATGMATTSTHTGFNNCLTGGIFDGIFNHGMRSMGEATMFSRIYLISVYGTQAATLTNGFIRYLNLMGDPTAEVWVTIPKTFSVTTEARIISGTPMFEATVKDASNVPIPNASVNLWQVSSGLNLTAYTNAQGKVYIDIPSTLTGSITLTVSKHDFKPATQSIAITGSGLVYQSSVIDDDNTGGTVGNSNGIINAGETIDMKIQIGNSSSSVITGISTTVTCSDPYITLINNSLTFANVNPGASMLSTNVIRFTVSPSCPDYHPVVFTTSGSSSAGQWTTIIRHIVRSPDLDYVSHTITGNGYLEIGETTPIYVNIINNGSIQATNVYGELRSLSAYVTVTDNIKLFGNIASGSSYSNSANPFTIYASSTAIVGMVIPLELYMYNASGYNDTERFNLIIGNPSITDPLGQDAYGYFIYDMGDVGYPQCPTYGWIEIATPLGGAGTLLAINDPRATGDEGDQTYTDSGELVTLPFTFRFYGVEYNQITVVSNGFLALGVTNDHDFRNWRLPGAVGPNAMIAPFWDDLTTDGGGGVYVYNDVAGHRFIIEWYNMTNGSNGTSIENFQVILYNPAYYPTSTNDGPIKIQYKDFNNVDSSTGTTSHGCYSTIGIKDPTGLIGLEYSFNNTYPSTALPLTNQSALYITTAEIPPNAPFLSITNTTIIDPNGNGIAEPNEALDVRLTLSNMGSLMATNVLVTISESDPWISISGNTASFGNIAALGNATNTSGLTINVLPNCPNGYTATVDAVITSTGYTYNRTFTITISTPVLGFGNISIQDYTGNSNGSLDPGETATIIIPLNNTGGVTSGSGNATLTCSTNGITINTPATVSFTNIPAGGSTNLSFSVTASSGMSIGTLAALVFNATAGTYTANKNVNVEIGAPHVITIGAGTSAQGYPIDRWYNYSVHESIYLASEMETSSTIKSLAFYKASGSDVNPIDAITIYMKHTNENSLSTGTFSTTGYTQVYNGTFPNTTTSGWMEVNFSPMFVYNGIQNLSILIVKGYQQYVSNYPQWTYTTTAANRARQERSDSSMPTNLSATSALPNIQFKVFPTVGILYPPQNLTASASHQSVKLDWSVPVTGSPTGYKIFKNSVLLTTVTALTYTDTAVTNGVTYSYYMKAVYSGGESAATETVQATPNAISPTNLTAVAGNGFVNLAWTGATGREIVGFKDTNDRAISGYRVYRNGSPVITLSVSNYSDIAVINETTYTYYVTTVYSNPNGESAPSNTVQAMPSGIIPEFATIGNGTLTTASNATSPINVNYRSVHGQSVYTAAELNAVGVYGPAAITQLGFYVVTVPIYTLPNFLIRMKHTSDTNVFNFQTAVNMQTVYSAPSYSPTSGGYDMLTFNTPFIWNGIDNIVVDTAFSLVDGSYNASGTVQYTAVTNGFRSARSDATDQTNVFVSNHSSNNRPNIKLGYLLINLQAPEVTIEHIAQGTRLSWPAVSGANSYRIYSSNDPDSDFTVITNTAATEYTDTSNQLFRFYKVVASDQVARNFGSSD